jgi:hypothetical protein
MVVVVWIVGALVVVAIAVAAVGVTSAKLSRTPRPAVFDIEEVVAEVAGSLPDAVAARLSYDDLRLLVRWYVTYLRQRGMATYGGVDHLAERTSQAGLAVVADDDEAVDELLARAAAAAAGDESWTVLGWEGIDPGSYDAVDVVCVVELVNRYLFRIGAATEAVDLLALDPPESPA